MELQGQGSGEGGIVEVLVMDGRGRTSNTTWTLDGSCDCCESFTVTEDQTVVDPGGVATFTINPPCPGATCEVTSNSGCTLGCSVSPSGKSVVVVVGASDCGTFTVTVTSVGTTECPEESDTSGGVKINNTGQGGAWEHDIPNPNPGCSECGAGGAVTQYTDSCLFGVYKYGGFDPTDNNPCEGTWTVQCKGPADCNGHGSEPPCTSKGCGCGGDYPCCAWGWWRCAWECTC